MSGSTSRSSRRRGASEAEAISRVVQRLRQQFPEMPPDALAEVVNGHYEAFDGRPLRDFVPILVERATRADLEAGIEASAPAELDASTRPVQPPSLTGADRPPVAPTRSGTEMLA